jgi:hypothetical protein
VRKADCSSSLRMTPPEPPRGQPLREYSASRPFIVKWANAEAAAQLITNVVAHDHGALPRRGRPFVPVHVLSDWGQIRCVKIGASPWK